MWRNEREVFRRRLDGMAGISPVKMCASPSNNLGAFDPFTACLDPLQLQDIWFSGRVGQDPVSKAATLGG